MSGGNCPETPRQKMIGMMYLMLTAMLALNVSGDLLNAFMLVDDGIKNSTKVVNQKISKQYFDFEAANTQNPKKAGDKYKIAVELKGKADSLYNQIQYYKCLMVYTADGEGPDDEGNPFTPDNYQSVSNQDIAAQLMITEMNGKRGDTLKSMVDDFRNYLVDLCKNAGDTNRIKSLEAQFNTADVRNSGGDVEPWIAKITEHIPMAATMSILSKLQNDVRSSQSDIVNMLYAKVDEASFKFTGIKPLAIPESNYVLRGQKYKADIMLAAYDETMDPIVTINGEKLRTEAGQGKYEVAASSVGQKKYTATIQIPDPVTGELKSYEVEAEYEVGEPSVVVSPTKMNAFYIGLDNPVDISAAGISSSDLIVTATGASILKSGSGWIVRPNNNTARASINVSAKTADGTKSLGSKEFRLLRVPNPEATIAGLSGGKIKAGLLKAQAGVFAEMKDFVMDVKFTVTGFAVSTVKAGFLVSERSNGATFTPAQKNLINGLQRGQKFYIEEIKATGPGGNRKLSPIAFTVD